MSAFKKVKILQRSAHEPYFEEMQIFWVRVFRPSPNEWFLKETQFSSRHVFCRIRVIEICVYFCSYTLYHYNIRVEGSINREDDFLSGLYSNSARNYRCKKGSCRKNRSLYEKTQESLLLLGYLIFREDSHVNS